jgi:8-oxo-dGTP pyrophosphatase MutT (NUDIX family)
MAVPSGPEAQGSTSGRFQAVVRVLVFVRRDERVLLLRGAPNKPIWPGLLNGIGGHVEANEDPSRRPSARCARSAGSTCPRQHCAWRP